jgi:tetratricopeptide (TPR) repeat protein
VVRFRVGGWGSWIIVLLMWLGLGGTAAALSAVHARGVWVAAAAGIAATLGSLMTAWVAKALLEGKPDHPAALSASPGRLRQLPLSVADFTGRHDLVQRLCSLLLDRRGPTVVTVAGQGGVGKTTLAIRVGHELAAQFPDGQLYVNLRGVEEEQADPRAVLGELLRDLGVEPAAVPEGLDARARLYRSRLADRRLLVILDNARDEEQVRPLLPGDSGCAVLITSRAWLAGLEGVPTVAADVPPPAEAIELLGKLVGRDRVAAEPQAAQAIVDACGCLPLAVRVAGARLAARREWPLSEMARRLEDTRGKLDELTAGDVSVRASLALGYAGLAVEHRRAFRMLGMLRSVDFAAWQLAALLDTSLGGALRLAERLADAHLLTCQAPDAAGQRRYRFHDLVRDFARERLRDEESAESQEGALRRFLGACLSLTELAESIIQPGGITHTPADAERWPECLDREMHGTVSASAGAWYASERAGLVLAVNDASDARLYGHAWELADNLCAYLEPASLWDDWAQVHEIALEAARQVQNPYGEAVIRRNLGVVARMRGQAAQAYEHYEYALAVFESAGDEEQIAETLGDLSDVHSDERNYAEAEACLERMIALCERRDLPRILGWACQMRAAIAQLTGCPTGAIPLLDRAESVFRSTGETRGGAYVLRCRGDALRDLDDYDNAQDAYESALGLLGQLGDPYGLGYTYFGLAVLRERQSDVGSAIDKYQRALAIFRDIGNIRSAAGTLLALGRLHAAAGNGKKAHTFFEESLTAYQSISDQNGIDDVTTLLADSIPALGRSHHRSPGFPTGLTRS